MRFFFLRYGPDFGNGAVSVKGFWPYVFVRRMADAMYFFWAALLTLQSW